MFSTIGRYPRFDVRLETVDQVPACVSREWRSSEWLAKDAIRRARHAYAFNSNSSGCVEQTYLRTYERIHSVYMYAMFCSGIVT